MSLESIWTFLRFLPSALRFWLIIGWSETIWYDDEFIEYSVGDCFCYLADNFSCFLIFILMACFPSTDLFLFTEMFNVLPETFKVFFCCLTSLYDFFRLLFDLNSVFLMFLLPFEIFELVYLINFNDDPRFSLIYEWGRLPSSEELSLLRRHKD